jgi:hypothetical protein
LFLKTFAMKPKLIKDKSDREIIITLVKAIRFYVDNFGNMGELASRSGKAASKALSPAMLLELNRRWLGPNSDTRGPNKKMSKRSLKKDPSSH